MPKIRSGAPVGASLVVLSSLFYASYGIWTTLMGDFFGGYTASALRSLLVLLLLVPIAAAYRRIGPIEWWRNRWYFAGLLVSAAFIWGPLYYAILEAGISISLAINYACIVLGMFLFGWLLAGERFTRDKGISAALGLAGVALIFSPSVAGFGWLALVAAVVSGLSSAAHYVIAKKLPHNSAQTTIFVWTASLLANIPMAFFFHETFPPVGWHVEWFYLVIFAVVSVVASWSVVAGMKLIDAGAAGVLGLLEIVFGVVFGVVLFHEQPGLMVLFGVVLVIAAAVIPYIRDYNERRGTLD
jgi:drug/metabolite transporter (DMT)-like permease